MRDSTLSIVIPAFNEEGNIRELYRRITGVMASCMDVLEILFVDDGSNDSTARAVVELHKTDRRVGLIRLSRNFGHEAALMAGLDFARGDIIIAMDGDLQHPPEVLPQLIARWRAGANVVHAVREYSQSVGWMKNMTSKLFYLLLRRLTSVPIEPNATNFFLLEREVVDAINRCRENPRFTRGLIPWAGFRREFVPYVCPQRYSGKTKYSFAKQIRLGLDGIFAFSASPLRIAGYAGLVATVIGTVYLVYALGIRIFGAGAVSGWASLVAVVIFMGGAQLIMLWVIGEYIARIADQGRGRPPYVVSQTILAETEDESLEKYGPKE